MRHIDEIREALEVMRSGRIGVTVSLYMDGTKAVAPKVANSRELADIAEEALVYLSEVEVEITALKEEVGRARGGKA